MKSFLGGNRMKKQKTYSKTSAIKQTCITHIKNNQKEYIIILLIFIIGILLSVAFINNTKNEQKEELNSYISNFTNSIKENKTIDKPEVFRSSIIKNIIISVCLWLLGCTVTLIPIIYIVIIFKGFCLGYTVSAIIRNIW